MLDDWFKEIAANCELSTDASQELLDSGFVVIPGPVSTERVTKLAVAYDSVVAAATPPDLSIGSTTTRVHDLVNRSAEFDESYIYRPVLEACSRIIAQPFKLSTLLARTVHPHTQEQPLHVDFKADESGWPMVGFILMIDEFKKDNGATCFVPGSHKWSATPSEVTNHLVSNDALIPDYDVVRACGPAGSVIIYNGSVWHGHTANVSTEARRSVQGSYIRRSAKSAVDQTSRLLPETRARINALAKYVLAV